MIVRFAPLAALVLAASGCARPDPVAPQVETDPAVALAVIAPLLTDPDLATQNAQFAAIAADPFAPDPVGKNAR